MPESTNDSLTSERNQASTKLQSRNLLLRRVGIAAAIVFLLVSGLVFLFASVAPGYLGNDLMGKLKGHPVIEAEFGELQSCVMSFSATATNGNPDVLLFEVVGTKDKGLLIVDQITTAQPAFNIDTIVIRKYDGPRDTTIQSIAKTGFGFAPSYYSVDCKAEPAIEIILPES